MSVGSLARTLAGPGLWSAFQRVRDEARIAMIHRKSARRAHRLATSGMRLNCGCGPNVKPGWINIDLFDSRAECHLDLRCPMPFPDGSVTMIYSEHFFEHLEYPTETAVFLAESLRALASGGVFRVGVPDTEWPINSYATGDSRYFNTVKENRWHPEWCDTRMHNLNYHFRQVDQHKYAYDRETLERVLIQAGFSAVGRVDFDPTFDTECRKNGTLYVEARKR
jgi:predicted SAM-dependent methyltransferase